MRRRPLRGRVGPKLCPGGAPFRATRAAPPAPRCPWPARARPAQARRAFLPPPSAGAGVSHGAKGTEPSQTVVAEPPRRVRWSGLGLGLSSGSG